jgi:hypothetical protein
LALRAEEALRRAGFVPGLLTNSAPDIGSGLERLNAKLPPRNQAAPIFTRVHGEGKPFGRASVLR